MNQVTTSKASFRSEALDDATLVQAARFLDQHAGDLFAGDVEVSLLTGGASNVNLKVVSEAGTYALRLCSPDALRWGVSRAAAIQAQKDASELGLAPRILASELPEGHFLAEFVTGRHFANPDMADDANLRLFAEACRKLNENVTAARDFSPFNDARTFVDYADAEKVERPPRLDEMLAAMFRIEAVFSNNSAPIGFGHFDLNPMNGLGVGDQLVMVDFDYSGMGWTAFELAYLACQAELDDKQTETLLRFYDPEADAGQRARVELMRFVAGIREATWALMAAPILGGTTTPFEGFTYEGHAALNIRQATRVVESGLFETYLRQARHVRPGARC